MKGAIEDELDAIDAGVVEFICDALSTPRSVTLALHGLRKCEPRASHTSEVRRSWDFELMGRISVPSSSEGSDVENHCPSELRIT